MRIGPPDEREQVMSEIGIMRHDGSRRRRGGMLIGVILGLILLAGLLASVLSYNQQASTTAETMKLNNNAFLISNEVRQLWSERPGHGRRDWTEDVMAVSGLDPNAFSGMQVWFVNDVTDAFQLRFTDISPAVCRRMQKSLDSFGAGVRTISCMNGERVFIEYSL